MRNLLSLLLKLRKQKVKQVEIAVVLGGGNILRGAKLSETGFDRTRADQLGMIATVINAMILQNHLEKIKVPSCVLSAVQIQNIVETYNVHNCKATLIVAALLFLLGVQETHILRQTQQQL